MQFLIAHYVAVTVWSRGRGACRRLMRPAALLLFRFCQYLPRHSAVMTGAGWMLSAVVPLVLAAALLFLTPFVLHHRSDRGARSRLDWPHSPSSGSGATVPPPGARFRPARHGPHRRHASLSDREGEAVTGIETTLAPLWPYIVLIIVRISAQRNLEDARGRSRSRAG